MDNLTVRQARLYREKTQQQLADALCVHVDTYRKIEENPDLATIAQAKKIAEFLCFDYDSLFFGQRIHKK